MPFWPTAEDNTGPQKAITLYRKSPGCIWGLLSGLLHMQACALPSRSRRGIFSGPLQPAPVGSGSRCQDSLCSDCTRNTRYHESSNPPNTSSRNLHTNSHDSRPEYSGLKLIKFDYAILLVQHLDSYRVYTWSIATQKKREEKDKHLERL